MCPHGLAGGIGGAAECIGERGDDGQAAPVFIVGAATAPAVTPLAAAGAADLDPRPAGAAPDRAGERPAGFSGQSAQESR